MSSTPAAGMVDARAVYERQGGEMDSEIRRVSSGESWVQDPRSGILTMVDPSMGEAKSGLREDMEIRGVNFHSRGNGSGGSTRELKADSREAIPEKRTCTGEQCLHLSELEEGVDIPNQKLHDPFAMLLNFEPGELRLRDWRRYLRKYRRRLKQFEDWSQSCGICHLLRDVLPAY